MTPTTLPAVTRPDFSARTERDGRSLVLTLSGNADLDSRAALAALLADVHDVAREMGAERVWVDLSGLEFMNSSCFKHFVWWLGEVQDLGPADQYRILFRSAKGVLWQRRSLHALRCLAEDIVAVDP